MTSFSRVIRFAIFLFLFVLVFYCVSRFDIISLVHSIGVGNSYVLLFVTSIFGGVSSFTSGAFTGFLLGLGSTQLSFVLVSIIGGLGFTVGDSLFYGVGKGLEKYSRSITGNFTARFAHWFLKSPDWVRFVAIFAYTAFTPLPGDILVFALAFARYPLRKALLPMLLGNIVYVGILYMTGGLLQ